MSWKGTRVAVWGAARSGIAAANLLADLGAEVVLSDQRAVGDLSLEALDSRVRVIGGGNVLNGASVLVPSPGIPPAAPALVTALASGVRLVAEVELAASVATAPIVAITGTDGKSTTTEMIGAVCRGAGRPTVVAGNIGDPLSNRVRDVGPDGVIVAEISEFQLWSCGYFRPQVAVVTNVAEDHSDYFGGDVAACTASIARVLHDMGSGDTAILRADDPVVWGFKVPAGVKRVAFGPYLRATGWGADEAFLTHNGQVVLAHDSLSVGGPHNIANAQAALAAGTALGLPLPAMVEGLRSFKGLPHRLERLGIIDGVTWYDDSKATNPHAAAVGLRAVSGTLIVIVGGFDKGLDLKPVIDELVARARHVVVMGTTAEQIVTALAGRVPHTAVTDMDSAVRTAAQIAHKGERVVLSPAASSFDQFKSYAHRGEVFQAAVRALKD